MKNQKVSELDKTANALMRGWKTEQLVGSDVYWYGQERADEWKQREEQREKWRRAQDAAEWRRR